MPTEIDPRLLQFLPFYKALFLRNNPDFKGKLSDKLAQEAFLAALREAEAIKEVTGPDEERELEPKEKYLKSPKQP